MENSLVISFDQYKELLRSKDNEKIYRSIAGSKTQKLALVSNAGLKTPNGFIITNNGYHDFLDNGGKDITEELWMQTLLQVKELEETTGKRFGVTSNPLLLCIRADSDPYLPHMLDCIINVGLNDVTAFALEQITKNRSYVYNSYCKFIRTYSSTVLNVQSSLFDDMYEKFANSRNLRSTSDFSDVDWVDLCRLYKSIVSRKTGRSFPQDPNEQLRQCIRTIFFRQMSSKVKIFEDYYKYNNRVISMSISEMIATNTGEGSCCGTISTHDPVTGEPRQVGEYGTNATHDDLIRRRCVYHPIQNLSRELPAIKEQLDLAVSTLEAVFEHEPAVFEFMCDAPILYITQVLPVPFSYSGLMHNVAMMQDAGVDPKKALTYITLEDILSAALPDAVENGAKPFTVGLTAGHGAVTGTTVFTPEECIRKAQEGEKPILVKRFICASDFLALTKCTGVITQEGTNWTVGTKLARMLRKTAAIGCKGFEINEQDKAAYCDGSELHSGDTVTIDSFGRVFIGDIEKNEGGIKEGDALRIIKMADEVRGKHYTVYSSDVSADGIKQSKIAGAEGFVRLSLESLAGDAFRSCAMKYYKERSKESLEPVTDKIADELTPLYKESDLFPLAVKLFDTPLSTYIPSLQQATVDYVKLRTKKEQVPEGEEFPEEEELREKGEILDLIKHHQESNPLMGNCGIRMAMFWPFLLETQIRGVFKAAKETHVKPSILFPGITHAKEVDKVKEMIKPIAEEMGIEHYRIGAELDTARGCLCAASIAESADYVVIDYNKLCQTMFGMDRKDAGEYLNKYIEWNIMENPFENFDSVGIASIIEEAARAVQKAQPTKQIVVVGDSLENVEVVSHMTEYGVNAIACKCLLLPIAIFCCALAASKLHQEDEKQESHE